MKCAGYAVAALAVSLLLPSAKAATPVLTRSYDNGRTGANLTEMVLTPQLDGSRGLRLAKSLIIDDDLRIEAQPLYVPNLMMSDGLMHSVVFVASMGNHIFAFDAEAVICCGRRLSASHFGHPKCSVPGEHRKTTIDPFRTWYQCEIGKGPPPYRAGHAACPYPVTGRAAFFIPLNGHAVDVPKSTKTA